MGAFLDWLKQNVGVIVACTSLLFTVFTFHRLNLRHGNLHVSPPRAFEIAQFSGDEQSHPRVILRLPLVFFNDGAIPIVVQNLQLVFLDEFSYGYPHPFRFWATVKHLTKKTNGEDDESQERLLAYQFPVKGREAVSLIGEFWGQPGELMLGVVGRKRVELRAKLGDDPTWQKLIVFSLRFTQAQADAWVHTRGDRIFVPFTNSEEDDEVLPR